MPTLPSLDNTNQLPRGKLPSMKMADFKPTATLNPYAVIPRIGAPTNEFKNHTEVWEIVQKIREQEQKLLEVNPPPKLTPSKLLAHGEHPGPSVNDSLVLNGEDGCHSMPSARAEKDLSEVMFLDDSEQMEFSLPDIAKFRQLTAPKISFTSDDNKTRKKGDELVVNMFDPSFRTVTSVQREDAKGLEAQFVEGIMGLTRAQANMYLADFGACAAPHPQERNISSHSHNQPAYPQFHWSAEQDDDYVEAGDEQRWQKYDPTAHAQRFFCNTGEIDDNMESGDEHQWQNSGQRFYLSMREIDGYLGSGNEQQWQDYDPIAHDQRFNLGTYQAGSYTGPRIRTRTRTDHDSQRTKSSESMNLAAQGRDEDEEDEEGGRHSQKNENEDGRQSEGQKKHFLRLLMDKIRKKKPPRENASPSEYEQSGERYPEDYDLFL